MHIQVPKGRKSASRWIFPPLKSGKATDVVALRRGGQQPVLPVDSQNIKVSSSTKMEVEDVLDY